MTSLRIKKDIRLHARLGLVLQALLIFGWISPGSAQDLGECGTLDNPYGPFDYNNPVHRAEKLPKVEKAHFDYGVRTLDGHSRKVFTWSALAGDIAYTLRVCPNHHQALYSMAEYHVRNYQENQRMQYTPECWFKRAHRWTPDDGNVWLIEGIYQAKTGKLVDAEKSYRRSIDLMPDSAEAHYNIGLLYVKLKEYELAREHAVRAYDLGYPMPGLKSKLARLGEWQQ